MTTFQVLLLVGVIGMVIYCLAQAVPMVVQKWRAKAWPEVLMLTVGVGVGLGFWGLMVGLWLT